MFAITEFSRKTQRTVCMLAAAVIALANIGLGVLMAQHAGPHYLVTITQLY